MAQKLELPPKYHFGKVNFHRRKRCELMMRFILVHGIVSSEWLRSSRMLLFRHPIKPWITNKKTLVAVKYLVHLLLLPASAAQYIAQLSASLGLLEDLSLCL